jgi:hypothetical protein
MSIFVSKHQFVSYQNSGPPEIVAIDAEPERKAVFRMLTKEMSRPASE